MRIILIFLSFLTSLVNHAQVSNPEMRIVLYNGEIVTGTTLKYESPLMKDARFLIDNDEYQSSDVRFFQNSHGYFANLNKIHGDNAERYAMRIRTGKLHLWEEIDIQTYGGEELQTADETQSKSQDPMLATGETFEYYSKGEEPVRIANYQNLTSDLSDNEESMKHLKKYRNYRLLQWTLLSLGSGVVAYEIISKSGGAVKMNPFMAFGIVLGGSSYFLESPKHDELWLAVDAYNQMTESAPQASN